MILNQRPRVLQCDGCEEVWVRASEASGWWRKSAYTRYPLGSPGPIASMGHAFHLCKKCGRYLKQGDSYGWMPVLGRERKK